MIIERALSVDAKMLTELTIRSKSYWNYSSMQINKWKDDLTISYEYIEKEEVFKLVKGDLLIGYYSYLKLGGKKIKLDNIFLEPAYIGLGLGKFLMNHFFQQVKNKGYEKIELDAEPYAEKFYLNLGFKVIGQLESSIKNRFLPIMALEI